MNVNSLKFRLASSALLILLVLLPSIGFTLNNAFETHLESAIKGELTAYSYSVLADAEYIDGSLLMPEQVMESRFNIIDSGLYAVAVDMNTQQSVWQSSSALNLAMSEGLKVPVIGESDFYQLTAQSAGVLQRYFISSLSVSFASDEQEYPVTLHVISNQQSYLNSVAQFQQQLIIWLVTIAIIFIAMIAAWLVWTLRPLTRLAHELSDIEQGERQQIEHEYPTEITPVTHQLNHLLKTEQGQRLRYRNALSDLAHSLKTPLAAIRSTQNVAKEVTTEVDKINNIIEHQLKRAQSAGQSAWRLSVEVQPCVHKLINAFDKIYRDKGIDITANIPANTVFKGDEADLFEMLGNLIDNAFKAANHKIQIDVKVCNQQLYLSVSDDGKGVAEQEKQIILQRGLRADTYEQGHGIGLAIVRDLVESYQGTIDISRDEILGGAKFTLIFTT